jgi:protein-L-isoaspartate(D-aspartate) O-methyltransferase
MLSTGFNFEKESMVKEQLKKRGINDERVLSAFRKVERHKFVLPQNINDSYKDYPLPIGSGQTISQPYIVALMTELLRLKENETVLEIGTGSGYQTAILAELCSRVYTVERIEALLLNAKKTLTELGYSNIYFKTDDGSAGWKENAPYSGIIVTCAAPQLPTPLKEQLSDGGRLVIPIGGKFSQTLMLVEKKGDTFKETCACDCVFVPLIGKYGWANT